MSTDSITCILAEIQHGSAEGAERLYARYQPLVMRVIRRHLGRRLRRLSDSLDFSQAVWKTIFENAAHLRSLDNPNAIAAYVAQIAANKVHTEVRAQYALKRDYRRNASASVVEADGLPARDPTPSQCAIAHEQMAAINSGLNPSQRKMIEQRIAGYSLEEIAQNLEVNERTVRRVLKRVSDSKK